MAEAQTYKSRKPLWWTLAIAGFVVLALIAYVSTQRSEQRLARTTELGTTRGVAFDPSTGSTTPAGALPEAMQGPPLPQSAPAR